jgi:NADPH:quinone reductase-like Zn-dependent oxidoreductase
MKAVVYHKYGSPEVLELEEVEKPTPKDDEVLIKVHAASVNAGDWHLLRGKPFMIRLMGYGLLTPKHNILGSDIAGRVEAVGTNVRRFQPGDEVMGVVSAGSFAEYVCARENALVSKPAGMTFEDAAAVPTAALTALQGLRDGGRIQTGQKVLINGAGGGVGTFAVQIAKSFGAEVTAVTSTGKLDRVRSIGADQVIDYTREDFTRNGRRYDLIFDPGAYRSFLDYRRTLNPNGKYVMAGGSTARLFQVMFVGPWISMTGSRKMGFMGVAKTNQKDLEFLKELLETGKVTPVVDRRFKLEEIREAVRYLEEGRPLGKVVVTAAKV